MRNIRNILSTFTLLVFAHNLYAQELSGIKEAKPVSISGSVNAGISYLDGIRNINDFPIGYNLGINLNLDFYSVFQIPFSFYFSNYGTGINTLSFKRFGISPSYKAIKLHLGYRSYVLSPYALTGMTMLGGGVELTLKKFNFLAFAGKVAEPYFMGNQYATFADSDIDFYKRWAYGVRLGFGKPSNSFKIHLFHAKDNPKTGSIDTLVRSQILPSENLVLGLETQQTIFKILTFSANGAASLFTPNLNGDPIKDNNKWLKGFNFINTTNSSSRMSFAYDAKISVRIKTMNVGFKYQHIDPFYSSLGVSFLQTNYNNYLADLSGSLFKGKLSLMSSVGFQVYDSS
ncbi:MAG: hypothetical protein M9888_08350 [Chitinophagales bacterium]|nr:hypothetical protein [Chitinophagales bacterium]